jgi:hypothetical protein
MEYAIEAEGLVKRFSTTLAPAGRGSTATTSPPRRPTCAGDRPAPTYPGGMGRRLDGLVLDGATVLLTTPTSSGARSRMAHSTTTSSSCCQGYSVRRSRWAASRSGSTFNNDVTKGTFDRRRSLPIARSAPLVGAVLADVVRHGIVCVVTLGFGYVLGLGPMPAHSTYWRRACWRPALPLCLCWASVFVGLIARTSGWVQGS